MKDYLSYALMAAICCLITGIGLFIALRKWAPARSLRLGIVIPASLLAFATALLIPPAIAISRGSTPLPSWTALLLPVLLLLCLPAFWRSVLNRLPASDAGVPVVQEAVAPSDMEQHGETVGTPAQPVPGGNILAAIAAAQAARSPEGERVMPNPVGEACPVPVEDSQMGDVSELPADVRFEDVVEVFPTSIPLVPEPVPPWVPFLRLVDKAWEERSAGRPVQAASWFLASLSRSSSPAVREEILMDLCALLKEHGYVREALSLLSSEVAAGSDARVLDQIRSQLRMDPPMVR